MDLLKTLLTSEPAGTAVAGRRDETDDFNAVAQRRGVRSVILQDLQITDEIKHRQIMLMTRYVATLRAR